MECITIDDLIDDIRNYLDNVVHGIVSPDHWNIYSDLCEKVDNLKEAYNFEKSMHQ